MGSARATCGGYSCEIPKIKSLPRQPSRYRPAFAMSSEVEEAGLDLFQEPTDFYEPEKQATFASHQLLSGKELTVRLVGHNPLWVRLCLITYNPKQTMGVFSSSTSTSMSPEATSHATALRNFWRLQAGPRTLSLTRLGSLPMECGADYIRIS